MTISTLGHTFTAVITYGDGSDSKPTKTVDTHQAIKKPLYYVRFGTDLPDDAVKLAYAASDDIEADDNVVIVDRSAAAPENSPQFVSGEESFTSDTFSSYYLNILFTDTYTEDIPSQPLQPLFYRHIIDGEVDTDTVFVLDSNFDKVNTYSYRVIEHPEYDSAGTLTGNVESVGVYNSFENSFDDDTGELIAYYVQYVDADGDIQTILLNNENVYREATFSDINWTTLKLKTWVKAYTVRQVGNHYEFTLPNNTDYTVHYGDSTRIKVEAPIVDSNEFPWFVRITNGAFKYTYSSNNYLYHIAEFNDQQFNPLRPYKFILEEEIYKVSPGLVQLLHAPTALADWPVDIIIKDRDDTVLHALTTNTTKIGTTHYESGVASGATWDGDKILSYDSKSGLVHLDVTLKDYYTITASYYYTEEYYEFSLVNLNPILNSDVLEYFYVIYLVPETNYNSGAETLVHYLKVGKDGIVIDCSQTDISDYVIGLPYGRPIQQSIGSSTSGVLGMEFMSYPDGEDGYYDFLRQYTLEAPTGYPGQDYPNRYLVLAELSVVNQTTVDDTIILDIREQGGNIVEDLEDEAKELNSEVAWYGDAGFGNGVPYPARGAVVVRLPCSLLEDYGGTFTEDEVRQIAKNHMPFGHYPVIDFYGVTPRIYVDDIATAGAITIKWPSEGDDYSYNVYYNTSDGRFSQHNTNVVGDNPSGNEYTITGLTSGVTYGVYVTAVGNNISGISITQTNVCGGGGVADVGVGAGDGFDVGTSHEGPPSTILYLKPR